MSLELQSVCIALRGKRLFAPISCSVEADQPTTIMGPSGSGKSTLLAFIGGFLDHAFVPSGEILIDGAPLTRLPAEQRRIGILFQEALLFPHLTVGGNLAFGLRKGSTGRPERRRIVEAALAEAGLAGYADRDPSTLSGGERARVALLRTLMARPRALLLDEPFSRLDRPLRRDIRQFVFSHAREASLPVLLVTHDMEDAEAAGGPLVELSGV